MSVPGPIRAALLTTRAPGAIAAIAIEGPGSASLLQRILRLRHGDGPASLADHRPTLCALFDEDQFIDDVLAVRLSHARQEHFELTSHGGTWLVHRILRLLERHGAKIFPADQFTGPPGLGQIESDVDQALLRCESRRLTLWLLNQRVILPPYLRALHDSTMRESESAAFRHRSETACRLLEGLHVAILGPPNAGKSTLANRLIGRDRVITSDTPGTTRDWVSETALIRGWPVTLTDTAGVRSTECMIEQEAIRRGRAQAATADLCLILLDASSPAAERQSTIAALTALLPAGQPHLVVPNKSDLAGMQPTAADQLTISVLTGQGIEHLELAIEHALGFDCLDNHLPTAFLRSQLSAGPMSGECGWNHCIA